MPPALRELSSNSLLEEDATDTMPAKPWAVMHQPIPSVNTNQSAQVHIRFVERGSLSELRLDLLLPSFDPSGQGKLSTKAPEDMRVPDNVNSMNLNN